MTDRDPLRERPAARRRSSNLAVEHGPHRFHLTVGRDERGRVIEAFYGSGFREGAELGAAVMDACVLFSMACQHGAGVDGLARSLSETTDGGPGSIVAAIVRAIQADQRALMDAVRHRRRQD